MTKTNVHDLIHELGEKKDDPNIPLAPFKRFIKIHAKGKYVSDEAAEALRAVFYEFAEEVTGLADTLADLMRRKTIKSEMIRKAYDIIRKKDKEK